MRKKPTATDVARRAEVSRTAVSMVLGGRSKVARLSEATQARVRKAAKELNYVPNSAGRSLVIGRTQTIGLILRDLALLEVDPYLLPLLNGILQRSRSEGYRVLVESARTGKDGDPFGDLMDSGRIDGMIVENPDYGDPSLKRLIRAGRPVVLLGSQGLKRESSVSIDSRGLARLATKHLISIGRRRVAHIGYASKGIFAVDERLAGYREALQEAGLPIVSSFVKHASFSMESGYHEMKNLLRSDDLPDAVFVGSDAIALGAIAAAKDLGLRIPRDIAFSSIDDIEAARFCRPSLTTVPSKPFNCGTLATGLLIEIMAGRKPAAKALRVETDLIIRGSSDESYQEMFD